MKNVFSINPPDDLILKALDAMGLPSLTAKNEVDESFLNHEKVAEVLEELRPYYYPCYYKTYCEKEQFDFQSYITVVRQMLRIKSRKILRRECSIRMDTNVYKYGSKYHLDLPPSGNFTVDFA